MTVDATRSPLYSMTTSERPRLRLGVMLDRLETTAWVYRVLKEIQESGFARIELVVLNASTGVITGGPGQGRVDRKMRWVTEFGKQAYFKYLALDRRWHAPFLAPLQARCVQSLLQDVPVLPLHPICLTYEDRFTAKEIDAVRRHGLDVILRFGFRILRGDILESARYGIWSYHYADNREYRGGPPYFWEAYEQQRLVGVILQRLTNDLDGGQVLYRSFGARQSEYWVSVNGCENYWKASSFIMRCLRRLYLDGEQAIQGEKPVPYNKPVYRVPTNRQMLFFMGRIMGGVVKNWLVNRFTREQWFLAYRKKPGMAGIVPTSDGFQTIPSPRDRFYADPFLITYRGSDYLFFEDYEYRTGKGVISYLAFTADGTPGEIRLALERSYHLSYPFVFEWQGAMYMVPETHQAKSIQLFRATAFPDRWVLADTLLSGVMAADATLLEHEQHWYMFVNISESGGSLNDELFLFVAPNPLGPWSPHPLNPVKSDVRSARPAGRIFKSGSRLIRPGQDCGDTYGGSICFCEIMALSPTDYQEKVIGRLQGDWLRGQFGTHTYNSSNRLEVVDGKRRVWVKR